MVKDWLYLVYDSLTLHSLTHYTMLEQLKLKSLQAVNIAQEKGESLKSVTQKGTEAFQAKVRQAADSVQITIPTSLTNQTNSSSTAANATGEKDTSDKTIDGQEEEGLLSEFGQECNMSKRQRIYGAIGCYALGAFCGFFSTLMLWGGPRHVKQFAFFYTISNLCGIGSSLFLIGPRRQVKVMCMPIRRVACCIWISAMLLTLFIALGFRRAGPLVLLLVIVQYMAMLWYGASFIPYGRAFLKKLCQKVTNQVTSM